MVLYFWLITYHERSRRRSPSHWATYLTHREDGLEGDKYHAVGSPFHGYDFEVQLGYKLADTRRQYTRIFLGQIDERWNQLFGEISRSITCPGISPTPLDPFAVGASRERGKNARQRMTIFSRIQGTNCQNWAVDFVQALIDQGVLDSSALVAMREAPVE